MASIDVQINDPQLVGSQQFKVRYRELPSGIFSAYQIETNAPFTVTGLNAGSQYLFEIIVVLEGGEECPPTFWTGTAREFLCPTFTINQIGDGVTAPYQIEISYTLPVGYVAPCKYHVRVRQTNSTGGWQNATFNTLPASPFKVNLPSLPLQDYDVEIYSDQCDGTFKYCFDDTVPAPEPTPCVPLVVNSTSILLQSIQNGFPKVALEIFSTNSTPIRTNTTVYFVQRNINIVPPNIARTLTAQFRPPIPSGNNGYGMILAPTKTNLYYIDGYFTDACGVLHQFTYFLDLS